MCPSSGSHSNGVVFSLANFHVDHLRTEFLKVEKIERWGDRVGVVGGGLVRCHVRGTSAAGWPNTIHGRLPIRKPLKPPTVNRKNCRNIKIVFVSTYALQGWKAWISSPVAVSPVVEGLP